MRRTTVENADLSSRPFKYLKIVICFHWLARSAHELSRNYAMLCELHFLLIDKYWSRNFCMAFFLWIRLIIHFRRSGVPNLLRWCVWFAASMFACICLVKMSTNSSMSRASRKASGQHICYRSQFNSSKLILDIVASAFSFRQERRVLRSNCAMWTEPTTVCNWQTSEFDKNEETNTRSNMCSPCDGNIFNWMRLLSKMKVESSSLTQSLHGTICLDQSLIMFQFPITTEQRLESIDLWRSEHNAIVWSAVVSGGQCTTTIVA